MQSTLERDALLLEMVQSGAISVTEDGIVTNHITGKEIGFVTGGYKRINMFGLTFAVNRLVHLVYIGPIPEGYVVDHIDDDKLNNHKSNLQAISEDHNKAKAILTGRTANLGAHLKDIDNNGANNGMAKLSEEDVLLYREAFDRVLYQRKK